MLKSTTSALPAQVDQHVDVPVQHEELAALLPVRRDVDLLVAHREPTARAIARTCW